jgi:hypothetical protein
VLLCVSTELGTGFGTKEFVIGIRGTLLCYMSSLVVLLLSTGKAMSAQSHVAAVDSQSVTSNVVLARGLLTRSGKAGSLWTLRTDNATKFRDESVLQVSFTTPPGEASLAYAGYEGKVVEIVGEVKSVIHGNAELSKVRTVGILDSTAGLAYVLLPGERTSNPGRPVANSSNRLAYKKAYYLFLASIPTGCQACYVPLLITQLPLEEIANGKAAVHGVFLITYERDSIWETKGAAPIDPTEIETAPRTIHVNGNSYRYQEISPGEVLRLLENPYGTIAISRPMMTNKSVPGASVPELITDFRALLRIVPAGTSR